MDLSGADTGVSQVGLSQVETMGAGVIPASCDQPRPSRLVYWGGWISLIVALCCGGEILRISYLTGLQRSEYLDADPFNGDFQTFDPIRRLYDGQWLYRDFDVYLGIGPTLMTAMATAVSGGDYRASLFSTMFLCVALHGFVMYLTGRLCGYPRALAAVVALLFVQLIRVKTPLWLNETLASWYARLALDVAQPAGSILAIRVAVGPVVVAILAITWRWWQTGGEAGNRRRAIVIGGLAGLGVLWSNDAGIPLAAALYASLILLWLPGQSWFKVLRTVALAGLVSATTAFVALMAVTRGSGLEWFRFNFQGVARDQFWYYVGDKVLTVSDIPFQLTGFLAFLCLAWLFVRFRGRGHQEPGSLLFTLLAAVYFATLLSQVGGAVQPRYGRPSERLLFLIGPYVVYDLSRRLIQFLRGRKPLSATRMSFPGGLGWGRLVLTTLATLGLLTLAGHTALDWQTRYLNRMQHDPVNLFPAERLAGPLTNPHGRTVSVGESLRREYEQESIPERQRLFSLYVSFLDLITDARNPSRHDQIIHALGRDRRPRYLADLAESNVSHVSTPKRDRFVFEPWLRCVNWPIYEHVFRSFDPVTTTRDNVIWKRRATLREWIGSPQPVEVRSLAPATLELRITIPEADRKQLTDKALVLVEFDYETEKTPGAALRGLIRQHLIVEDISVPFRFKDHYLNWGLPVGKGRAAFAVDASLRSSNVLYVSLLPTNLSRLSLQNARSTTLFPLELIDDVVEHAIYPSPVTRNVPPDPALRAVLLENAAEARHLRVGDVCEFAITGQRRILNISGNVLFFDGAPFEGGEALFPATVRVVNPIRRAAGSP